MILEKNAPRLLGAAFLLVIVTSLIAGIPLDFVVWSSDGYIDPDNISNLLQKIPNNLTLMHLSILGGILNATAIVALAVLLYVVSASYVIVSEDEHLHKEKVRKYAMSRGIEIMKLKDFCIWK